MPMPRGDSPFVFSWLMKKMEKVDVHARQSRTVRRRRRIALNSEMWKNSGRPMQTMFIFFCSRITPAMLSTGEFERMRRTSPPSSVARFRLLIGVTLPGQRNAVVGLAVALHVEHREGGVQVRGHARRLAG